MMIAAIKNIRSNDTARRLLFLYLLNVSDWFCTVVILRSGYFFEANPIMQPIINNIPVSFTVKCLLPMLLILYACFNITDITKKQEALARYILNAITTVYTLINATHIVNYILLFAFNS